MFGIAYCNLGILGELQKDMGRCATDMMKLQLLKQALKLCQIRTGFFLVILKVEHQGLSTGSVVDLEACAILHVYAYLVCLCGP